LDQSQQVPTIQLMINTNGQGRYLGINVNNYCITPITNNNNTTNNTASAHNSANSRPVPQSADFNSQYVVSQQ